MKKLLVMILVLFTCAAIYYAIEEYRSTLSENADVHNEQYALVKNIIKPQKRIMQKHIIA